MSSFPSQETPTLLLVTYRDSHALLACSGLMGYVLGRIFKSPKTLIPTPSFPSQKISLPFPSRTKVTSIGFWVLPILIASSITSVFSTSPESPSPGTSPASALPSLTFILTFFNVTTQSPGESLSSSTVIVPLTTVTEGSSDSGFLYVYVHFVVRVSGVLGTSSITHPVVETSLLSVKSPYSILVAPSAKLSGFLSSSTAAAPTGTIDTHSARTVRILHNLLFTAVSSFSSCVICSIIDQKTEILRFGTLPLPLPPLSSLENCALR